MSRKKKSGYDPRYDEKVFGGHIKGKRPKGKGRFGLFLLLTLALIGLMVLGARYM